MNSQDLFKSKKFLIILSVVVIIIIFSFIFVLAKVVALNSQCIQNPFIYAADRIVISTDQLGLTGAVPAPLCSCSVGQSEFWFDHEGIYRENPQSFTSTIN